MRKAVLFIILYFYSNSFESFVIKYPSTIRYGASNEAKRQRRYNIFPQQPLRYLTKTKLQTWPLLLSYDDYYNCRKPSKVRKGFTIPLIGPIPNKSPLLIGSESYLDSITPMQWASIEESILLHRKHNTKKRDTSNNNGDNKVAAIDASPLIAIIDDVSGKTPIPVPSKFGTTVKGRYATLAAIVGISSKKQKTENRDNTSYRNIDTSSDNECFMESVMRAGMQGDAGDEASFTSSAAIRPYDSKVRLVGVARAVLHDFFYKVPTENDDNDGDDDADDEYCYYDYDEEDDYDENSNNYIVMAEFDILLDKATFVHLSADKIGEKGGRSVHMSPVHSINEMSKYANRVTYLHDARRKIVNGLSTAKARLQLVNKSQNYDIISTTGIGNDNSKSNTESTIYEYNDFEDFYDGLDSLFSLDGSNSGRTVDDDLEEDQQTIDDFLSKFGSSTSSSSPSSTQAPSSSQQAAIQQIVKNFYNYKVPSPETMNNDVGVNSITANDLENHDSNKYENFGLGYYSSLSSMPDLTKNTITGTLSPYYSKSYLEAEEFEYEIFSFIVFKSLENFCTNEDIAWSLQCTNTIERLKYAYSVMYKHKSLLEELAHDLSNQLSDCGEECTDLW